jgi:hypothetical protein
MKKILLSVALLATTIAFSQTFQSDDFNTGTLGNIGTAFDGGTAGQLGYFTAADNGSGTTNNAGIANFQIATTGINSTNGLSLVGPNGSTGNRFMWKDGLPAAWNARTSGNNIIEVEVDVNPGARGGSRNLADVVIYNSNYSRQLVGFSVNAFTGELRLLAYATPSGNPVGNYNYGLAAAPGVLLPENTWSRVGVSYNFTTGGILINSNRITGGPLSVAGSSAGTAPFEIDFVISAGSANTAAATILFDNFIVKGAATNTLLDIDSNVLINTTIAIYPNPATDLLNINMDGSNTINVIQIVDLNGRQILSRTFDNVSEAQIDVNDFSAGMYLINITSGDKSVTKKFLKQ